MRVSKHEFVEEKQMTSDTKEKEERISFLGIKPSKKWKTRTSRMNTLHDPLPKGVWLGFLGSALLFTMLHVFNKWWWHEDFIP